MQRGRGVTIKHAFNYFTYALQVGNRRNRLSTWKKTAGTVLAVVESSTACFANSSMNFVLVHTA